MGKGDKRRPIDERKVEANWPFERPKSGGGVYVWCQECKTTHDRDNWCGSARRTTNKTRAYGFALMDIPSSVAKLLQHDQLDFSTTTIGESAAKMRKDYVERTASIT